MSIRVSGAHQATSLSLLYSVGSIDSVGSAKFRCFFILVNQVYDSLGEKRFYSVQSKQ